MEGGFQTDKERPQGSCQKGGFWLDWSECIKVMLAKSKTSIKVLLKDEFQLWKVVWQLWKFLYLTLQSCWTQATLATLQLCKVAKVAQSSVGRFPDLRRDTAQLSLPWVLPKRLSSGAPGSRVYTSHMSRRDVRCCTDSYRKDVELNHPSLPLGIIVLSSGDVGPCQRWGLLTFQALPFCQIYC